MALREGEWYIVYIVHIVLELKRGGVEVHGRLEEGRGTGSPNKNSARNEA